MTAHTSYPDETIAAIATPLGRGALAVLRVSGSRAQCCVANCLPFSLEWPAREPFLVSFCDEAGDVLDQVLLTWFRAPDSYTGEDVVEISCHGSPVITHRILETLVLQGARLAEPGEFTLRAFLNGKLDLSQAEAVRDLIDSRTTYQAQVATRQLRGHLSRTLSPLKETLVDVICNLETSLEFVEDDVLPASRRTVLAQLEEVRGDVSRLEQSYRYGRRVGEGILVVIAGRPNVGKSSVFNRLVKKERVIVATRPGTTRDTVDETIDVGGIPTRLVDTAGIRETLDEVERDGVLRSQGMIDEANLVLVVVDRSELWSAEDESVWKVLEPTARTMLVLNKADRLAQCEIPEEIATRAGSQVTVSALTGQGIDLLEAALVQQVTGRDIAERDDWVLLSARHHECLLQAREELDSGLKALREGLSEEFALYHLRKALTELGAVTGETTIEDLLTQIFSTFCIGK